MIIQIKEKLCRFMAKLTIRLLGHPQGMTIFQEEFFPGKFLAITVLDTAHELDLFREEQEWLDEVAQKARAEHRQIEGPECEEEEDELDRDIDEVMKVEKGKKTLLQ